MKNSTDHFLREGDPEFAGGGVPQAALKGRLVSPATEKKALFGAMLVLLGITVYLTKEHAVRQAAVDKRIETHSNLVGFENSSDPSVRLNDPRVRAALQRANLIPVNEVTGDTFRFPGAVPQVEK